jgi:hypothetical protein
MAIGPSCCQFRFLERAVAGGTMLHRQLPTSILLPVVDLCMHAKAVCSKPLNKYHIEHGRRAIPDVYLP